METFRKNAGNGIADRHRTWRVAIQGLGRDYGNEYSISTHWFSGGYEYKHKPFNWPRPDRDQIYVPVFTFRRLLDTDVKRCMQKKHKLTIFT